MIVKGGQFEDLSLGLERPRPVRMNGARATAVKIAAIVRKITRDIRNLKRGCWTATVCARASVATSDLPFGSGLSGSLRRAPSVVRPDVEDAPLDERDDEDAREEDPRPGRLAA